MQNMSQEVQSEINRIVAKILDFTFCVAFGVALHDFAHQVWQLKGIVLSLEGGYIGFIVMFLSYFGRWFVWSKRKKRYQG